MFFFEWYVGVQNLHLEDALVYKTKSWKQVWKDSAKVRKSHTPSFKRLCVFPCDLWPYVLPVLQEM